MPHSTTPDKTPPAARAATLPQQKADFTAEGAPPPGVVSNAAPIAGDEPASPDPDHPADEPSRPARHTIKLKRPATPSST